MAFKVCVRLTKGCSPRQHAHQRELQGREAGREEKPAGSSQHTQVSELQEPMTTALPRARGAALSCAKGGCCPGPVLPTDQQTGGWGLEPLKRHRPRPAPRGQAVAQGKERAGMEQA